MDSLQRNQERGFTLAELLISLAILAEIATFTVPKVLLAQQSGKDRAIILEDVSTLTAAYTNYKQQTGSTSGTKVSDFLSSINYIKVDSSGVPVDNIPNNGSSTDTCGSGSYVCLRMHNGSSIYYDSNMSFNGTGTTNTLWFHIDPDGTVNGQSGGNGMAVSIILFYNGRVSSWGQVDVDFTSSTGSYSRQQTAKEPAYFYW